MRGNHDNAVNIPSESMNAEAQAAIEWTRGRLGATQRRFLAELPLTLYEDDRLYVHSDASNPQRWRYVQNTADAGAQPGGDTCARHLLRPYPQAGAVFDVCNREDDGFIPAADVRGATAWGAAMACRSGLGGPAARRQSGRFVLRCSIPGPSKLPIAACPTISRRRRCGSAKTGLPHWLADRLRWGGERWPSPVRPGAMHRRLHDRGAVSIAAAWRGCGA